MEMFRSVCLDHSYAAYVMQVTWFWIGYSSYGNIILSFVVKRPLGRENPC